MDKHQWHESRRRRHEAYRKLWDSESPELREAVKGSMVPSNTEERARNLRWRVLGRVLRQPQRRSMELAFLRELREDVRGAA